MIRVRNGNLPSPPAQRLGKIRPQRRHILSGWLLILAIFSIPVSLPAAIPLGHSIAPMLEKVMPGVVNISTRSHRPGEASPYDSIPGYRRFFQQPKSSKRQSLGSGVIIDAGKGWVLTNFHVIKGADVITVTLSDKRRFDAKVLGGDPEADVALLQIEASDLTAVPMMKDSEQLRVGDFVVAIGNPFGLGQTATSGMISALGRSGLGIEGYEDFIQTDASINPGNSGGALVTLNGELAGMNTAIVGPSGGNVGIGFAIPVNMIQLIVNQLAEYGEVRRGQLGVVIQDISPRLKAAFDLPSMNGSVVSQVLKGSAAERAGVKAGDVILAVNGTAVENSSDLRNAIGFLPVGETVELSILRDGERRNLKVTIASNEDEESDLGERLSGVILGPITKEHPLYGQIEGVEVLAIQRGAPAAQAGLQPGDIITSINRQQVGSRADVVKALRRKGDRLLLHLLRGDGAMFLVIQ